jgi:xylan 1,4-beta-xylosidase
MRVPALNGIAIDWSPRGIAEEAHALTTSAKPGSGLDWRKIPRSIICHGLLAVATIGVAAAQRNGKVSRFDTYCNPIDLAYRFQLHPASRREAADPTMVFFKDQYWLFPSKSGGYWQSPDLLHWNFIAFKGDYPAEQYAPTAAVYNGRMYLTAFGVTDLWVAKDLAHGEWEKAAPMGHGYGDPAIFVDDDNKVYMTSGCSEHEGIKVTELDPKNNFKALKTVEVSSTVDPAHRGWENRGEDNTIFTRGPSIEGSWMTKHEGLYYLQYAAPGTEYRTYADGVVVGKTPFGPFKAAELNPFSFKPTGFVASAGHSSTFAAADGRYWHVATMSVAVRASFERRLGLFPTWFTPDGTLVTDTYLGDYPHYISGDRGLTGWMLLSRKKPVTASSAMPKHPVEAAVDEDIRTWWSATSGKPGEWFEVDLGKEDTLQAIQINFGDEGSTTLGRSTEVYKYVLEGSRDHEKWQTLVDHSTNGKDAPDDYEVLPKPIKARYVRIKNIFSPNGANFSLSDLRVFGSADGSLPHEAEAIQASLDPTDTRHAKISWNKADGADFYVVRLGPGPEKQSINYQIYDGATSLDIHSLVMGTKYFVSVDSVNETGITHGKAMVMINQGN